MTRKELVDRQTKHDAYVSKIGQVAAKRYLDKRQPPDTCGSIRAGLAFVVLAFGLLALILSL